VYRYEGRVTLFHGINETSYRTVYPEPPESGEIPDCTEGGVLGSLTGITGSIMATEAIKWITEIGECLDGKMLIFDVMQMSFHTIMLPRVSEAADYQIRSSYEPIRTKKENQQMVQEITPTEFRELKSSGRKFTLIDVREPYEYEENNLGGILIPLHEIPQRHIEIPKDHQVVVHCRSGVRSAHAIEYLQKNFGYGNLMNLQGGILACLKNT
jgi:adenylyltransferase/sulfurtransferase